MKKIDQKIVSYVFDNFFVVLEGRDFQKIMDTNKNLKEIQLQTFADEVEHSECSLEYQDQQK